MRKCLCEREEEMKQGKERDRKRGRKLEYSAYSYLLLCSHLVSSLILSSLLYSSLLNTTLLNTNLLVSYLLYLPLCVNLSSGSKCLDSPKSINTKGELQFLSSNRKFSSFKSRCKIPYKKIKK